MNPYKIQVANSHHYSYAPEICELIEKSARQRGTGIAKRDPEYIRGKMADNQAIIALTTSGTLIGFCYIESWENKKYVANSGLIVHPDYRGTGMARRIKKKAFEHSKKLFPDAKLFGLTTSLPVMKINSDLGYQPVTFDNLTTDETFWKGCHSCVNYEILQSKNQQNCLCTAMLYDPKRKNGKRWNVVRKSKIYERFLRIKASRLKRKKLKK